MGTGQWFDPRKLRGEKREPEGRQPVVSRKGDTGEKRGRENRGAARKENLEGSA